MLRCGGGKIQRAQAVPLVDAGIEAGDEAHKLTSVSFEYAASSVPVYFQYFAEMYTGFILPARRAVNFWKPGEGAYRDACSKNLS